MTQPPQVVPPPLHSLFYFVFKIFIDTDSDFLPAASKGSLYSTNFSIIDDNSVTSAKRLKLAGLKCYVTNDILYFIFKYL